MDKLLKNLVPRGRIELPLSYENRILSPNSPPVPNESISLHCVQSVTYTFRSSGARDDGDTCHTIVTVQSTGQSSEVFVQVHVVPRINIVAIVQNTHRIFNPVHPCNPMNNQIHSTGCTVTVLRGHPS